MSKKLFQSILVAGALAGALMASAANSQIVQAIHSPARGEVDTQISQVIRATNALGFRFIVADERGSMVRDGAPARFRVRLQAGVEYRFAGRCDNDCADVDLALLDASGRELISDRDGDARPAFSFRAPYTGDYSVQVELFDCRTSRCEVGAIVLARG
jgi:hypothetical protein